MYGEAVVAIDPLEHADFVGEEQLWIMDRELPLLVKSEEEHQEVKKLVDLIRSGSFDAVTVTAFVELMRKHLEREIHDVFTLVEDLIPTEQLVSMSNWDVDHLYETNAKRKPWAEKWLG